MIKGGMNKCITKLTLNLNFPGELLQKNNKIICTENFYFPLNFTKSCKQSDYDFPEKESYGKETMESLSNANLERTLIKSFHFEFCILHSSEKYQELQSACKAIVPLIKPFVC